ncbi:MAG: translation initiation factor [Bacteroidales bacterium]|nr:translation initiation factor [Bacteroidales bacterium]
MSKKQPVGVVYSTNPDFVYQYDVEAEKETLPPDKQQLRVSVEHHHRGGKTATIVKGFIGTDADLLQLAKTLKTHCGVGGSAKDGEIVVQGDMRDRVVAFLISKGYKAK